MSVHDKYLVQVCLYVYLQGTDIMSVQVWLYNYIYILSEYWRKCLQVRLDVYCSLLTCTGCTSPCCRTSTTTCMAASRTWVWEWKKESSTCFRYTCIMVLAILKTDRHSGLTQTDGINTIHKTHRNNSVVKSISTSSTHCCNDIYFLSKTLLIVSYMYMYFYLKLFSESKLDVCFHEWIFTMSYT